MRLLDPAWIPTPLSSRPHEPVEIAALHDPASRRTSVVFRELLRMWLRLGAAGKNAAPATRGRIVRESLDSLGGAFIKLGQLIALRHDLFSPEFCLELGELHDRAKAFPFAESRRILEAAYGRPIEEVFSELDEYPIAAASIGQCHLGRLREGGHRVAVKVQRPDAAAIFARDLRFFETVLGPFRRLERFRHYNWDDALWELRDIIREEIDYRYEAAALRTFRRTLRRHRNVYVPKVFDEWCTPTVLVLEYIPGVFMTQLLEAQEHAPAELLQWQEANGVVLEEVGRTLMHSLYRQMFEDHLFHGDLHPGNIIILRDNRICLIDFGTVGRLDVDFLDSFHSYMAAVASRDFETAIRRMLATTESLPRGSAAEIEADFLQAFRSWHRKSTVRELPHKLKSVQALSDELGPVMKKYRISMNWAFLRMNRAFGTLDITTQKLLPNIDHPREMLRYQKSAAKRSARRARTLDPRVVQALRGGWLIAQKETAARERAAATDDKTVLRRMGLRYRPVRTKVDDLVASVGMRILQAALLATLAIGLGALAVQWLGIAIQVPDSMMRADNLARMMPRLAWWEWLIAFAIWIKLFLTFRHLHARFREPERVAP